MYTVNLNYSQGVNPADEAYLNSRFSYRAKAENSYNNANVIATNGQEVNKINDVISGSNHLFFGGELGNSDGKKPTLRLMPGIGKYIFHENQFNQKYITAGKVAANYPCEVWYVIMNSGMLNDEALTNITDGVFPYLGFYGQSSDDLVTGFRLTSFSPDGNEIPYKLPKNKPTVIRIKAVLDGLNSVSDRISCLVYVNEVLINQFKVPNPHVESYIRNPLRYGFGADTNVLQMGVFEYAHISRLLTDAEATEIHSIYSSLYKTGVSLPLCTAQNPYMSRVGTNITLHYSGINSPAGLPEDTAKRKTRIWVSNSGIQGGYFIDALDNVMTFNAATYGIDSSYSICCQIYVGDTSPTGNINTMPATKSVAYNAMPSS